MPLGLPKWGLCEASESIGIAGARTIDSVTHTCMAARKIQSETLMLPIDAKADMDKISMTDGVTPR